MRFTGSASAKVIATAAVVLALGANAAAVAGASTGGRTPHISNANVTKNMDNQQSGFNVNTSSANLFQSAEIMEMVWPGVYILTSKSQFVVNTDLVKTVTSKLVGGAQTTTYVIKPTAVWSDGTKITADDFIYNWQAQNGSSIQDCPTNNPGHCAAYDDAGTTGYSSIASVKGSKPASGPCKAGSSAQHTLGLCPNGLTVTVTYVKATPFADWQGLFGLLLPAHQARIVGWNSGYNLGSACDGNCPIVSGAWYKFKSFDGLNTIVLTKNPSYYGAAATVNHLTFLDYPDDTGGIADLSNGTLQVFEPNGASAATVDQAKAAGVSFANIPSYAFEHLDFNQSDPILSKLLVRKAIASGTDRQSIINSTDGLIQPTLKPLDNHMIFGNEAGYVANGKAYDHVNKSAATGDLKAAGYKMGTDGFFQTTGTGASHDLTLTIRSTTAARRATEMQIFQGNMAAIGIKIKVEPKSNFFSNTWLYGGNFQLALFAWVGSPLLTSNNAIYCSNPHNTSVSCGSNYDFYSLPALDKLLTAASTTVNATTERSDYNKADVLAWSNMLTLPLYQRLSSVFWDPKVHNVLANPSSAGVLWNANKWSVS